MSMLAAAFARCREEQRAAFVPFLVAGDPDLRTTESLVLALARGGADVIELGVPFSDPIADGPTIQAAAARALESGTTLSRILEMVARLRGRCGTPIVLFTYFNPVLAHGIERFAEQAAASGIDGVLIVDLPPEEAEQEVLPVLRAEGLDAIFLLAPTSTRERIDRVSRLGSGFVYYVSRNGTTGVREELPETLAREVAAVRKRVALPVAVGFGIATPQQVAEVAQLADGVVVGSALVKLAHECADEPEWVALVAARAQQLAAATAKAAPSKRLFGLRRRG